MTTPDPPRTTVPSVLLPELLGFVPQFLLDDIIDTANDAVRQAVEAMEVFLRRWASEREKKVEGDWDSTQEIEQGLVAFQTLLNSHVDIAFDFFEAWSLRNIFAIPPDLPLVAPHHAGLDLEYTANEETELVNEIKELRRKIQAQRKLQRLFSLAVRKSAVQRSHSQRRLERLAFLNSPQVQTLLRLPKDFVATYEAVSSLPPYDPSTASQIPLPLAEPGKRPWETSKIGYMNWAVTQLVSRAKDGAQPTGNSTVGAVADTANKIGRADDIKVLLQLVSETSGKPSQEEDRMDES
ncbi:hypothetical protein NM688_g7684 [Phlebia brevispora]|uniref:Uncharacterized protein n=1 Tax=Phlebia brevispora TaxID=194682 RepID=A0ACC1S2B4_9APHY|nr:hypothetical protein NM688_g7684 [Phlebia brevispora]